MARKINVSFKETERELTLYNKINGQIDKSAFLKEAAFFYLEHLSKNNPYLNRRVVQPITDEADEIMGIVGN